MIRRLFLPVLFSLALPLGPALADCDRAAEGFDNIYCGIQAFTAADAELNAAYGALRDILTAEEKTILKNGERAWIKSRNQSCTYADPESDYVDLDCAVEATRQRVQFLKDRLAECEAGACQDDRLGGA